MHRFLTLALLNTFLRVIGASNAEPHDSCRDVDGKVWNCPAPAPVRDHCRDKTSKKSAKCSAANAEPVLVKAR